MLTVVYVFGSWNSSRGAVPPNEGIFGCTGEEDEGKSFIIAAVVRRVFSFHLTLLLATAVGVAQSASGSKKQP